MFNTRSLSNFVWMYNYTTSRNMYFREIIGEIEVTSNVQPRSSQSSTFRDFILRLRTLFGKSFNNVATRFLLLTHQQGSSANTFTAHYAITFNSSWNFIVIISDQNHQEDLLNIYSVTDRHCLKHFLQFM